MHGKHFLQNLGKNQGFMFDMKGCYREKETSKDILFLKNRNFLYSSALLQITVSTSTKDKKLLNTKRFAS
jgi:hypothetical protein